MVFSGILTLQIIFCTLATSFITKEEVKNYKSLDSYKYFVAGWVEHINWKVYGEVILIRGKVKHSYRVSEPPLQPWVMVQNNGSVVCGHCTCMAGLAETCSHVGALLYWTETAVHIRDETTCTSKKNAWLMPTVVSDIPYLRLKDIKPHASASNSLVPHANIGIPTDEEMSVLYSQLAKCDKKPIVLSLIAPHNKEFVQATDHLPRPLQTLYKPENVDFDYVQLLEIAKDFEDKITRRMRDNLQDLTHLQASCKKWFKYRAGE